MPYVGRFAPSPTGHLHFGTLAAAAASFLHARQAGGEWLVRIEDIDPPREIAGSAASMLRTLEALGLNWDRSVRYQGRQLPTYFRVARELCARGDAFYCDCSRQQIQAAGGGGRYPGTCRNRRLAGADQALRLRVDGPEIAFDDGLCGRIRRDIVAADGDFVIVRRDGLPAYHLAVVIDDADQGVTDVVRGADLLDSTPLHILLQRRLGLPTPCYWHIPLIRDEAGGKLSKGTGAMPVDIARPAEAVAQVLSLLGSPVPPECRGAAPIELWAWAQSNWRIESLRGRPPASPHPGR